MRRLRACLILSLSVASAVSAADAAMRGSADLGIVIERESGSVQILDTSARSALGRVEGLGDLSHASAVFSRDARYAYVFGRDGGLTKIDLLDMSIARRVVQGGNSIGGAISQDGRFVAVSNYEPGGVKVFDADTLDLIADLVANYDASPTPSKVVGLVDAPDNKLVYSLMDGNAIWVVDLTGEQPAVTEKYQDIGKTPYDALITPNGRHYIAGLFGEEGLALLDLWHPERGVRHILSDYGKDRERLPIYKMPHLEGWAIAGNEAFIPGLGQHEVLVIGTEDWQLRAQIKVAGQPVFVMARPDGRHLWVNFAAPHNNTLQVIDTETRELVTTLNPGKTVLHMEFTPRGEAVWVSVKDDDSIKVYDTRTFDLLAQISARKPSGIFFAARAHRIGL
jgi:protein NirF